MTYDLHILDSFSVTMIFSECFSNKQKNKVKDKPFVVEICKLTNDLCKSVNNEEK